MKSYKMVEVKKIFKILQKELEKEKDFINDFNFVKSFFLYKEENYLRFEVNFLIFDFIKEMANIFDEIKYRGNLYVFYNFNNFYIKEGRKRTEKIIKEIEKFNLKKNIIVKINNKIYLFNNLKKLNYIIVEEFLFKKFEYKSEDHYYKVPEDILFIFQLKPFLEKYIQDYKKKILTYQEKIEEIEEIFKDIIKKAKLYKKI